MRLIAATKKNMGLIFGSLLISSEYHWVTGRKDEGVSGPLPQLSLSLTLYNPSTSQHRHFSPEDAGNMFLRNFGI
jgi:hypothetical protein